MDKVEEADLLFHSGFNCCQSVFGAYAEELGINEDVAMQLTSGFGGGLGRSKNVCGAVSGAAMVIDMKYGNSDPTDKKSKDNVYKKVREFIDEFRKVNGSDNCYKLTSYDLLIDAEKQEFLKNNIQIKVCRKAVLSAVEILEKMLKQ